MSRILLIDDDPDVLSGLGQALDGAGYDVTSSATGKDVVGLLSTSGAGLVVTDVRMPDIDGLTLLAQIREIDPDIPVILMTAHGDIAMAVTAIRNGAYDFIEKPFRTEKLLNAVDKACSSRRLVQENADLRRQLESASGIEASIRGQSTGIINLRKQVLRCAGTDADVLIVGETGSGKELVARSLHEFSRRSEGKFVAINCAALPASLLQSEFFGHEAGAFTGAAKKRIGRFEYASGGVVFLDEIEGMSLDLQAELLRVLEDRKIVRLGTNEEIPVDIRVISGSKRDLAEAVEEGSFRADLYFRLNVLTVRVPPLRERIEDVALLFLHFTNQVLGESGEPPMTMNADLYQALMSHGWPGNVRELQAVATRFAFGFDLGLGEEHAPAGETRTLAEMVERLERHVIQTALKSSKGNVEAASGLIGVPRRTLYHKMKMLGIVAGSN